jgi:hypothetical protein
MSPVGAPHGRDERWVIVALGLKMLAYFVFGDNAMTSMH